MTKAVEPLRDEDIRRFAEHVAEREAECNGLPLVLSNGMRINRLLATIQADREKLEAERTARVDAEQETAIMYGRAEAAEARVSELEKERLYARHIIAVCWAARTEAIGHGDAYERAFHAAQNRALSKEITERDATRFEALAHTWFNFPLPTPPEEEAK